MTARLVQHERELREALVLKMAAGGRCTHAEIARRVGCSTRTVERILADQLRRLANGGGVS